MNLNNDQKIKLDIEFEYYYNCTFSLKGEFITFALSDNDFDDYFDDYFEDDRQIILIYSTQTKNNKWRCKRFYKAPDDSEWISISNKYDKFYLFSNNNIYEWNILTEKCTRIFFNEEVEKVIKLFV